MRISEIMHPDSRKTRAFRERVPWALEIGSRLFIICTRRLTASPNRRL
jgi:hypothetical protein